MDWRINLTSAQAGTEYVTLPEDPNREGRVSTLELQFASEDGDVVIRVVLRGAEIDKLTSETSATFGAPYRIRLQGFPFPSFI